MTATNAVGGQGFDAELEERFVRYVRIDTQSDESSTTCPTTERQYDLLRLLMGELQSIGATDVQLTDYAAVLATIPATIDRSVPTIAFLAHVDTSPQFNATAVRPVLHRRYDGSDIVLPEGTDVRISPKDYPYLATKIGEDIVTASGDTLLGADDKAGVAIAMTLAKHLLSHPEIAHGPIDDPPPVGRQHLDPIDGPPELHQITRWRIMADSGAAGRRASEAASANASGI